MKYRFLLFDADNTILDFDSAENQALQFAFQNANLHFDNNVLAVYKRNNIACWEALERGEMSRDEVLVRRFELTFEQLGLDADIGAIADDYERELHNGYFVVPHAHEVLSTLHSLGYKLYLVSNGVLSIQTSRMQGADMNKYFIKKFISEEIGFPKPKLEFFTKSFAQIQDFDPSSALIIGDSLTGDILGGNNAKIATCWFNPHHRSNNIGAIVDYEIYDLRDLLNIV